MRDGQELQHGARITAEAQGRFRPRMLKKFDYLSANLMTLASQAFVDLCAAERLNIDFAPVTMSA